MNMRVRASLFCEGPGIGYILIYHNISITMGHHVLVYFGCISFCFAQCLPMPWQELPFVDMDWLRGVADDFKGSLASRGDVHGHGGLCLWGQSEKIMDTYEHVTIYHGCLPCLWIVMHRFV